MEMNALDWTPFRKAFPIISGEWNKWWSVGEGWFQLMWELGEALEAIARRSQDEGKPLMRIVQVKEKFGGLRCYLDHAPDEAIALTQAASIRSGAICEACGEPGNPCTSSRGWRKTLCPYHELILGYTTRVETFRQLTDRPGC